MFGSFIKRSYFTDKTILILSGSVIAMAAITILRVLLTVQQFDFKIAVRYTQYGIDRFPLGDWYVLYEMAIFAAVTTIAVILIAMRLHSKQRTFAVAILGLHVITMIFLLLVSNALLSTSSVTS